VLLSIDFTDWRDEVEKERAFHKASTDFNANSMKVVKSDGLKSPQLTQGRALIVCQPALNAI